MLIFLMMRRIELRVVCVVGRIELIRDAILPLRLLRFNVTLFFKRSIQLKLNLDSGVTKSKNEDNENGNEKVTKSQCTPKVSQFLFNAEL